MFEYSMTLRLLPEHHLDFLNLKGGSTGLPGSTLVKMPHCWKSHAHMVILSSRILCFYSDTGENLPVNPVTLGKIPH